jgi:diaminopimelate decarboxylase
MRATAVTVPSPPPPARPLPAEALPPAVLDALTALAEGPGGPVSAYLYDPAAAAARARALRDALPPWAEAFYAVKANAFPPMLEALAAGVAGFEVSSAREVALACDAAAAAGRRLRLVASGPGKREPFLAALVAAGADLVNVESALELHRLAAAARAAGRRARVAIRVNPARVEVRGSLAMGGSASPFGVGEEDVVAVLAAARALPEIDVAGFHIHAVSNNLDAVSHAAYVGWCLEWSARTAAEAGVDLRAVDVGGGLGVTFDGTAAFDLAAFGRALRSLRPPAGVRVVLEPGRWLVADCGWYAAEVTDVKRVHGAWFAVLRGGINHFLLPASWDERHAIAVVPVERWDLPCARPEARGARVTVVGELCTPEDALSGEVPLARVRAGDLVVFPHSGAYGYEFALPDFLAQPRPDRIVLAAAAAPRARPGDVRPPCPPADFG